ncbi:MAG: UDP-N-acetylmuramoyl-L-alanine--D-glutamate ligase [Pseudomonadota bacterium]
MLGEENLKGKRIGVVGLGPRTGVGVIRYLCSQGADVVAYDVKPASELIPNLESLKGLKFELEAGTERPRSLLSASLLIVSPGVPSTQPFLRDARRAGIPVWGEVEFASRRISAPVVAITGSNGKSTTTALLGHILSGWRKQVFTGGNLGNPLINAVGGSYDFVVAEISSFQLETVETFRPRVALLLNVSPNHLDRHGDLSGYIAAKERLFARMIKEDRAIFNMDDSACAEVAKRIKASIWFFSGKPNAKADIHADRKSIHLRDGRAISLSGFKLLGEHNVENAVAAVAAAVSVGCPADKIEKGLKTFAALAHRLEPVATVGGIRFVNDSKSTTPEATVRAIQSFDAPVILLAGGRSKGAGYEPILAAAQGRVKEMLLYGEAADSMAQTLRLIRHRKVTDLETAFGAALKSAEEGDVVLLSPANASFDQYRDYEERGRHFAELVLEQKKAAGGKKK